MPEVDINTWAVLVAAVINMVLGTMWFSESFFGKPWMKEMGVTQTQMEEAKKKGMKGMWKSYVISLVGAFVMAYVMSHFLDYAGAKTAVEGAQGGFWVWLGFVAPVCLGSVLWEGKSWKLFAITSGYYLVLLLINGAVLATWV